MTKFEKRIEATQRQIEIFTLILIDDAGSNLRAAGLIRGLNAKERRDLRAALQDLDNLIDDVTLAEMRERRPWKL